MLALALESRRATRQLAAALAPHLAAGDVLWLEGELGAGKTFFTRGLLRALGVPATVPVTSPTFALVHEHEARLPIRHLDLYRLVDPDELRELGVEEMLEEAVVIIEWGARFHAALGARGIVVTLREDERESARAVELRALDARGRELLDAIATDPRVASRRRGP